MQRRVGWAIGSLATVLAALCFAPSTLFEINPEIGMVRPRTFPILNPLRDRAPEHEAETYLDRLRRADRGFLPLAVDPKERQHIDERESRWPVLSWRIGRRIDNDSSVWLMYWVRRGGGYGDGEEEVYLTIAKSTPPRLLQFGAIY